MYALFGTGDIAAYDCAGQELWKRNLGADYGKFAIMWIYGSSPLLFEGKLYVQVLQRTPAPVFPFQVTGGCWPSATPVPSGPRNDVQLSGAATVASPGGGGAGGTMASLKR